MLEDYALSCLRVGRELHVPVIDLHACSFRTLCDMGPEITPDYFMDTTHTNDYGALLTAGFIAEEIVRLQAEPLCGMRNDFAGKPWKPDVSLRPADTVSSAQKEERPILPTDLPKLPYADCKGIPQEGILKKAMVKGLLDPCILFSILLMRFPGDSFCICFSRPRPCR